MANYCATRARADIAVTRTFRWLARCQDQEQSSIVADLEADRAYHGAIPIVALVESAGARTLLAVPMLKDDELIGVYRHLPPGSARLSPTSRSSWCRTLPPKPSSPSRTRGCSTSCANLSFSSRPLPPTCSRSSAARRSICKTVLDTLVEVGGSACARRTSGHHPSATGDCSNSRLSYGYSRRVRANS